MTEHIVFFDFDGTLTHHDTLIPFLKYVRGTPQLTLDMIQESITLGGYVVRLIRNDVAKEALLRRSLGGMHMERLRKIGKTFSEQIIPGMLREDVLERLHEHKKEGHTCILVSASLDVYLEHWAFTAGFKHWITSTMEVDRNGQVTGRLAGGNCYGEEKALRVRLFLKKKELSVKTYGYGNSAGDLPMLDIVDLGFIVRRNSIDKLNKNGDVAL